ncbi:16279_t:CDS:2 [Funneliformis geosporum]|nr:16279_t:CDS:2 [Funneliformis geosporum]
MVENQSSTVPRPESRSSVRSLQLGNRSKREKYLDTLARLFTNNKKNKEDKCVAVCHDKDKLFISSNEKEPKHAKEYMEKLREFANNQTSDNYEELLNLAIEQICHIEPKNRERVGSTELLDNFLVVAKDYNEKISLKQKPSWERLPKFANELFQEVKGIDEDILKAIETNRVEYINGRHVFGPNSTEKTKLKLHAEMGMIESLTTCEKSIQYIGLTKLSCDDCYAVISLLNNGLLGNKDFELRVCHRHGKEYSNCEISKKETLSNPIELLERLQTQIEIPSKQN